MTLTQVIISNDMLFEIDNPEPNRDLLEALKEVSEMINNPKKHPRYSNWKELKKSLLKN